MNEKIYQVFVSSTYQDLIKERQSVIESLIEIDCFPFGMEMFPASDEEQWEMIKSYIDRCDYYMIVSAGKYGTLSKDNLSYTEKEYDYAIEIGKPVVAFIVSDLENIPANKTEKTEVGRERLKKFHEKLKKSKVVKFWSNKHELKSQIIQSIIRLKKIRPAVGWVRSDQVASNKILNELNESRKEIEKLQRDIESYKEKNNKINSSYEWYDDRINFSGSILIGNDNVGEWSYNLKWTSLYSIFCRYMGESTNNYGTVFRKIAEQWKNSPRVYNSDNFTYDFKYGHKTKVFASDEISLGVFANTCFGIICQFSIHNLIEFSQKSVSLTEFGKRHLTEINSRKREQALSQVG